MPKRHAINRAMPRVDAYEKVTGRAKYAADLFPDNLLYGKVLRSAHPHARILSIDTSGAESLPGVKCVLTAKDVPGANLWNSFRFITGDKVRYVGDGVAVVAAETEEIAAEALKRIRVEYEPLPGVFSIEEALAEGAPLVHEEAPGNLIPHSHYPVRKGDVEKGFAESDVILEREYRTPFIEHAYIEPEAVVAIPHPLDRAVTLYGSVQNPFTVRWGVSAALGTPLNKVRIVQCTLGGSFGGKEEVMGIMLSRAAMAALKTGRPVKMVNTREESLLESSKRHPFRMRYKVGAAKGGKILALRAEMVCEGGAYNVMAQYMNWRASVHTTGPYEIPNVHVDVYGVYTNNIYGGAMRGFTSPQVIFAQETLMDELAAELGMDPVELRIVNALRPGSVTATGHHLVDQSVTLTEVINTVLSKSGFKERRKELDAGRPSGKRRGIGLACSFRGCGYGAETYDSTVAQVALQPDGSVLTYTGLVDNGQGLRTAHAQIVAEVLGVRLEDIVYMDTDTSMVPDGGMTVASRGTFTGGNAMRLAAAKVRETLFQAVSEAWSCRPEDLEARESRVYLKEDPSRSMTFAEAASECIKRGLPLAHYGWHRPEPITWHHDTGQGDAFPTYSYGCVVAEVELDPETGEVEVTRVVSGHDVGTAINPALAKGQIYGGIAMGMGFGLLEEVETSEGRVETLNLDQYLIPTSMDVPAMEAILYESADPYGPFGAKSLGEPATETVAAAVLSAVDHAAGRWIRNLPASQERMLLGQALKRPSGRGGKRA